MIGFLHRMAKKEGKIMANSCLLTQDSKDYLACFYQILDGMNQSITGAQLTQSISHNFIVQMIPHHRAAIQMSQNILRYTKNGRLCSIANNIIAAQTRGIQEMEDILPICAKLNSCQQDLRLYQRRMEVIIRQMLWRMGTAPQNNRVDRVFLEEMIPHHQGAIQMSRNTLQYPVCVQLMPILRSIIREQHQGVAQMYCLLGQLSC